MPRPAQRSELIGRAHLLGHFRLASTVDRLIKHYRVYWPTLEADTQRYISACSTCIEMRAAAAPEHPSRALEVPGLFHRIAMDLVFGLPQTERGHLGIMVIVEYLSKFPVVFPIKSKTAAEISRLLFAYIAMFGPPREILSDQGREFVNEIVSTMCKNFGVERRVTSPYHPRTDGLVERTNQTLIQALSLHAQQDPENWDLYLDYVALAYRTRVHSTTGYTPFELMFGRTAAIFDNYADAPSAASSAAQSLINRAAELRRFVESTQPRSVANIAKQQEQQRAQADAKVAPRNMFPSTLAPGALVFTKFLRRAKKLEPRYSGPYRVESVSPGGLYYVVNHRGQKLKRPYPIDQLRVIVDPAVAQLIWEAARDPSGKLFPIDHIVDHKYEKKRRYYLIRWAGFDDDADTWEPEDSVRDNDLLTAYWNSRPDRSPADVPRH